MASTPKPPPIPDRYRRVTPPSSWTARPRRWSSTPRCSGRPSACGSLGPGGTIAHAEIEIGDSVVMVEDASPFMGTKAPPAGGLEGSPAALFIYVEDVDAVMERAEKLGATVERPAQRPVLRRPGRPHRRPVRASLDGRHPRRGRRARRDGPADERDDGEGGVTMSRNLLDPYRRAQDGFDKVLGVVPAGGWDAVALRALDRARRRRPCHLGPGAARALGDRAGLRPHGRRPGAPHPAEMAGTDPAVDMAHRPSCGRRHLDRRGPRPGPSPSPVSARRRLSGDRHAAGHRSPGPQWDIGHAIGLDVRLEPDLVPDRSPGHATTSSGRPASSARS